MLYNNHDDDDDDDDGDENEGMKRQEYLFANKIFFAPFQSWRFWQI